LLLFALLPPLLTGLLLLLVQRLTAPPVLLLLFALLPPLLTGLLLITTPVCTIYKLSSCCD
jgi:hypothetical protein